MNVSLDPLLWLHDKLNKQFVVFRWITQVEDEPRHTAETIGLNYLSAEKTENELIEF